jgi:hypothetical protein
VINGEIVAADIISPKAMFDTVDVPCDTFCAVIVGFISEITVLPCISDITTLAINFMPDLLLHQA